MFEAIAGKYDDGVLCADIVINEELTQSADFLIGLTIGHLAPFAICASIGKINLIGFGFGKIF